MPRYKCAKCSEKLESPENMEGRTEPCPTCRHANIVPLSRSTMKRLLKHIKDCRKMKEPDFYGDGPAIADAAKDGNIAAVQFLLEQGVNPDSAKVRSALYHAGQAGDEAFIRMLLAAGAGRRYSTPLHTAAIEGSARLAKILLSWGADPNAAMKPAMDTPLHNAASHGHADVVDVLLQAGAEINAKDSDGHTPLFSAAFNYCARPNVEIMKTLLAGGADINSQDRSGATILSEYLNNRQYASTDFAFLRFLLDSGINPDAGCPLYSAVGHHHYDSEKRRAEVVHLLLKYGANVNVRTPKGNTPLANAKSYWPGLAKMLIGLGAHD